jgi:ComF family protein
MLTLRPETPPSALKTLRHAFRGILDLVYPRACRGCERMLAEAELDFCPDCRAELSKERHEACPRCALRIGPFTADAGGCPDCRDERLHFDAAHRLGVYDGWLREAILRIKHANQEDFAEALGRAWAAVLVERLHGERLDAVVPVPLHWFRLFERGYNQAGALARPLARTLNLPLRPRWLRRARYTQHQAGQAVTPRRENMRGAFRAGPTRRLRGISILLVDDAMTTGSTCNECAQALKRAGAKRVVVAVLARTEK